MTADEMGRLLDELGKRLGPAGEHVYQLAFRQALINGVSMVLVGAVVIALVINGVPWVHRHYNKTDLYSDDSLIRGFAIVFGALACVFAAALVISGVSILLNPEYSALRDLVKTVTR